MVLGKEYYGFVSYDYKNRIEALSSNNPSHIHFPDFFFFEPEILLEFVDKEVIIKATAPEQVFKIIQETTFETAQETALRPEALTSRDQYLNDIKQIIDHIKKGNIYEVNYCVSFRAEGVRRSAIEIYQHLIRLSPTPFACFVKHEDQYLICASPERYFKLSGNKLISQPIKGTRRVADLANVEAERKILYESSKERNENVMIVDLVRNDLSKVCKPGTVKVDELFGVYQFSQLFQMISTISGSLEEGLNCLDVLDATFPMGSMTGAPKYMSMQLIEEYENFKRNIYSGTVGYILPNGDADFNVVIRSIFYDASSQQLSFAVGSGITALSQPEQEYAECLLKAENMMRALACFSY
jgi:para-aminobenzoate synthetase component 1